VGSTPAGHAGRLPVGRVGCARAIVGSARPIGPQRPARRDPIVGHAENRRARSASGAVLVRAFGAVSSAAAAPAAGTLIRAPTTGCGAVLVATGRISSFADLPRAASGHPARAGNSGSATAPTRGAPSSAVAAGGSHSPTTIVAASAPSAASTGSSSGSECR